MEDRWWCLDKAQLRSLERRLVDEVGYTKKNRSNDGNGNLGCISVLGLNVNKLFGSSRNSNGMMRGLYALPNAHPM